jgi:hypothetical protein
MDWATEILDSVVNFFAEAVASIFVLGPDKARSDRLTDDAYQKALEEEDAVLGARRASKKTRRRGLFRR